MKRFIRPPDECTHWTLCPTTKEPILTTIVDPTPQNSVDSSCDICEATNPGLPTCKDMEATQDKEEESVGETEQRNPLLKGLKLFFIDNATDLAEFNDGFYVEVDNILELLEMWFTGRMKRVTAHSDEDILCYSCGEPLLAQIPTGMPGDDAKIGEVWLDKGDESVGMGEEVYFCCENCKKTAPEQFSTSDRTTNEKEGE